MAEKTMRSDLRSGIFFLVLSFIIIYESLRVELGTFMEPGSGFLSFGVGLALAILSLILVFRGLKEKIEAHPHSKSVISALIVLFAYSLSLAYLGFLVATFLLVGVLFRIGERRPVWWLIIISAIVTSISYLIFGKLLGVFFPKGIFGI